MARSRPTKAPLTAAQKAAVLAAVDGRPEMTLHDAAAEAGVSFAALVRARQEDPNFNAAMQAWESLRSLALSETAYGIASRGDPAMVRLLLQPRPAGRASILAVRANIRTLSDLKALSDEELAELRRELERELGVTNADGA